MVSVRRGSVMTLGSTAKVMRVYHFLPEKHGLDDLKRRRLKISRLQDMNDPFEMLPAALSTKRHREALRGFASDANNRWGALCFSRNWENPLLWNHYADRHRGLCLGFDVPDECVLPVKYVADRLPLNIERQLSKKKQDPDFGRKLLVTKYKGWSYEDEVRSIVSLDHPDRETGLYFADFGGQLRLRQVIVGVRLGLSKQAVLAAISRRDKSTGVIKARLAFNTFTVVRQRNEKLWLGRVLPNIGLQPSAIGTTMSRRG